MNGDANQRALSPIDRGIERYASSMGRRFGWIFHLLGLSLMLRKLRFEEHSVERIRQASERGPIVYAFYHRSLLDLLALNKALNARRLPLSSWANGVRTPLWMPVPVFWRSVLYRLKDWNQPYDPVGSGFLTRLLASGRNASVFLLGRKPLDRLLRRPDPDLSEALLDAQTRCEAPIQVVPVVVVWSRRPMSARTEVERTLLGAEDQPGHFSRLWAALARGGSIIVQAGEPMDLRRFGEHYSDEPPKRQARILRVALRRYLYREQSIVRGPKARSHRWMRRLVLSSSAVRDAVQQEMKETGQSEARVRRRVERTFDKIAARMTHRWVQAADLFTTLLWNRIYSGVDVREADVDRIRQAQRRGGVLLLPCHRSHLDYLLVSSIMYRHDIALPHIAAGINLSFWPAGPIFRHLGAFFVKRSFKGDRIFPAVFAQYLKQLLREGFPIEFFIEGGRSRTGKLLHPKLGMLNMTVDAMGSVKRPDFDLTLLPINISYEQLAEENVYARELAGEKKKSESIGDVIKARRVLRQRYGRVYLRVGEPLQLREALDELDEPWEKLDRHRKGEWLRYVGERVLHRINQEALVLPSALVATALLAHHRRGVRRSVVFERCKRLLGFLEASDAKLSASMAWPGHAVEQALEGFVKSKRIECFQDEEGPVYRLADQSRVTLEYYKNSVLHFFVPAAILALVLRRQLRERGIPRGERAEGGLPVDLAAAEAPFRTLAWILRYEFVFDPDTTVAQMLREATERLGSYGALEGREADARVIDPVRLDELANLLANFVESYWLTLHAAHGLAERKLGPKELVEEIHKVGHGIYAVEEIRRAEALSAVNLRNAIKAFQEEGILKPVEGGGLRFEEQGFQQTKRFLRQLVD
jgi:glycerol-3-phosphate O-acyltransferase